MHAFLLTSPSAGQVHFVSSLHICMSQSLGMPGYQNIKKGGVGEYSALPIPPNQQVINFFLLIWVIQKFKHCVIKELRICQGVCSAKYRLWQQGELNLLWAMKNQWLYQWGYGQEFTWVEMYVMEAVVTEVIPWMQVLPNCVILTSCSTELGEVNTCLNVLSHPVKNVSQQQPRWHWP